jgi:hypothetical protein
MLEGEEEGLVRLCGRLNEMAAGVLCLEARQSCNVT